MPTKFKPTEKNYDRRTGKTTVQHNYLKATSMKDLMDSFRNPSTKPKQAQKIKKEIERRMKHGL
jgi:hypothetical protein